MPDVQGFEQAHTVFHLQIEKRTILKKNLLNIKEKVTKTVVSSAK